MDKITAQKFLKLLTSQPYFVWNVISDKEKEANEDNLQFNIDSFVDVAQTSFSEIQAKSFGIIQDNFEKYIKGAYERVKVVISKTIEDKIVETKKYLSDPECEVILNPVFGYEYKNHFIVSSPAYYDKVAEKLSFLKISTSTKRKDFLKIFFDSKVAEICGLKIDDISLNVLATKKYKQHEVDFYETFYINATKTGRSDKAAKRRLNFDLMQLAKSGESKQEANIYEFYKNSMWQPPKGFSMSFNDLDFYLDKIIQAKEVNEMSPPQLEDATEWGDNNNFGELIKKFSPEFEGINGKIVSKKDIIKKTPIDKLSVKSSTLKAILNKNIIEIEEPKIVNNFLGLLKGKVVWYDFEAFSLPIAPMDLFLPFQQVISQVSIIVTENDQEVSKLNIVIDPQKISLEDFVDVIKSIHKKGHKYVVYNKSYENTRLTEIVNVLKSSGHKEASEMEALVSDIIDNTIDLAELFTCSKNKFPPIFLSELKGKHSIKLLEKYINKFHPNINYKIKEYKNLDIKNGLMAMETANNRALNIIKDNEWKEYTNKLKEYCENDVRAMVMVYEFIKSIISSETSSDLKDDYFIDIII